MTGCVCPRGDEWSTWEELLLAFAVNRHGTKSWESIAMEIQNRTSSPLVLTAHICREKYRELQRRYAAADGETGGTVEEPENGDHEIPWLDELRKLRVAELRREVQRYDLSIVSLQSKVKRLEVERENSLRDIDTEHETPDLERDQSYRVEKTPKSVAGNDCERSFNESNYTETRYQDPEIDKGKPDPKVEREAEGVPGRSPEEGAAGERSYNGSTDSCAKGAVKSSASIPAMDVGESAELRESVAESKGEFQSCASRPAKRRRRMALAGSSSGGEDPDLDEVSRLSRRIPVKSQPLASFLQLVRSHQNGAILEHRLESQENSRYHSIVRQHLDYEMVRTKLEDGHYSDRALEFFRDLLLLLNNVIVFFPKNSSKSTAAVKLRELVSKEALRSFPKPSSILKRKPDLPSSSSLQENQSFPSPMATVPAKRPSASVKPSVAATVPMEPEISTATLGAAMEKRVTKKRSRDRSSLAGRASRSYNSVRISDPFPSSNSDGNATVAANEKPEAEMMKKSTDLAVIAKKRSAAKFLNETKRTVPSPTLERTLLDSFKGGSMDNGGFVAGRGGSDTQKKGSVGRGQGRKNQGSRPGPSGKGSEGQKSSESKRTVGRPPKRAAPPVQGPPRRARAAAEKGLKPLVMPRKRAGR